MVQGCITQPGRVALGGGRRACQGPQPPTGQPQQQAGRRHAQLPLHAPAAGRCRLLRLRVRPEHGDCGRPLRHPQLHPHRQAGSLLAALRKNDCSPAAASPARWTPFGCAAAHAAPPAVPAAPAAEAASLGRLAAAAALAGWTPFGRASSSGLLLASDLAGSAPAVEGLAGGPAVASHCTKPLVLIALGASGLHPQLEPWTLRAPAPVCATLCVSHAAVAPSAPPDFSTLPAARAHARLSCVNCHDISTLHRGAGSSVALLAD